MALENDADRSWILGIDIGSSSSRAGLMCSKTKEFYHVDSKTKDHTNCRYQVGEFSSTCYPFDDKGPPYLPGSADHSRMSISAKFIPYALTNNSDAQLRQYIQEYPPAESLLRRSRDPLFRARLRAGLLGLLKTIQDCVKYWSDVKHVKIQSIAMTLPAQWTLDFEELYRGLVLEVFNFSGNQVFFYTEVEGLAHTLITHHAQELGLTEGSPEMFSLFMDFGGHHTNVCAYNIRLSRESRARFFRLGKPTGAGGGSESWEYKIGELCFAEYNQHAGMPLSPQSKRDVLDELNVQKRKLGPNAQWEGKDFIFELQQPDWKVRVTARQIHRLCWDALSQPLLVAETQIQQFSGLEGRGVPLKVVVSGGTAKHPFVQKQLESICARFGLSAPVYSHGLIGQLETMTIAKGATLATASMITVDEFMARGAAFGLQMRQRRRRKEDALGPWDDTALFLLDNNHRSTVDNIVLQGNEYLKIICDPFRHAENWLDALHCFRCYDVTKAWKPSRGKWTFDLNLSKQGDSSFLVLKASKKPRRNQKGRPRVHVWTLPLYFDGGTNCVLVGERDRSLVELDIPLEWAEDIEEEEESLDRYRADSTRADTAGYADSSTR